MKYDVVVIGAGIVGLTSAYHIKKNNPDVAIAVVDRAPTYGQGNTAKSAAGFRDVFTSDVNFKLSNGSISFYREIQETVGRDIGLKFSGYMFLMNRGDRRIEKLKELSRKTRISFIDASDLREIDYLSLVPDAESAGIMGLREIDSAVLARNCGIIDPVLLCKYYYDECMALGVEFIFNFDARDLELEPVNRLDFPGEPFIWQDKRIRIIKSGSREIEAETFILATDVWTTALLDLTGIDSHVRPKKRQVFQVGGDKIPEMVFDDSFTGEGICPFTILPRDGIYLRPAPLEKSFWVGVADDIGRDFSLSEDPQPEIPFYDMNLLQVIRSYFPAFSRTKMTSGWAGYYSYNTIDKAPYIFRTLNLLIATGTSGSGILKGDGIGRTVEAVYSGRSSVKLHNGLEFDPAMLGVKGRNVEPEEIIL